MPYTDLENPYRSFVRPSHTRFLVLVWLCSAATIAYICRNSLAVAEESIRTDLDLQPREILGLTLTPKEQMGWVMSSFFLTYALFQLPTGWIGHVLGSRRALPLFSALWSVATAALGLVPGWGGMLLARLGMGAAQAGIFPCCVNTNSRWFPPTGRAFSSGALGSFMSIGGAAGTALTGLLLGAFGPSSWRGVFVLFSLPGFLWAIGFFLWFRDNPREHSGVNEGERELIAGRSLDREKDAASQEGPPEPTPWLGLLTSAALWWICAQQFFRAAGYMFFASWFPTYLRETRGVTTAQAGLLGSLPLLGVVVGGLVGGLLSDYVLRTTGSRRLSRQGVASISLFLCAAVTLLAYPLADPVLATLLISVGSFLASLAAPSGYTITMDMGGKHVAMVFSMMNMAGNIGALAFPILVPRLLYLTGSWDVVLLTFSGLFVAAALCWLPFDPNRTIAATPPRWEIDRGKV